MVTERGVLRAEWPRPSMAYVFGTLWFFAAIWAAAGALSLALGGSGGVSFAVILAFFVYFMRFAVTYELTLDEVRCRNGFASKAVALQPGSTLTYLRRAGPGQMLSLNQTFRRYHDLIEARDARGRTIVISPTQAFVADLETRAVSRGVTIERRAR